MKILMVCLGNICRSPMAEGVLRKKLTDAAIAMEVDSAGTGNYHIGETPDRRAIQCMKDKGIDISMLRARQFSESDFEIFDLIFAMDISNYENILRLARTEEHRKKVRLMLDEAWPGEKREVPDPYFGGKEGFDEVYGLLDKACHQFITGRKKAKVVSGRNILYRQ